ncbi:MAG: YicC/YloC family endoribonuclease [Hyphomicrobiaceae bacterium]|nr:YicC/YloC family endoribonuclease [Hyphomicrobiaceae bacterium]
MTLSSMTGFARAEGRDAQGAWFWELRSVNGRGLDIRTRLPPGYDSIEPAVREAIQRSFTRGSITVGLTIEATGPAASARINAAVLDAVIAASEALRARVGGEPASVSALLGVRGVIEIVEDARAGPEVVSGRQPHLLSSLAAAIDGLAAARREEGRRLVRILGNLVGTIETLAGRVEASPARSVDAVRARLAQQVQRLLAEATSLDAQRLHQEAVMIATRADVEEELKRIGSHIAAARDILASPGPAGRKLDFLAQEFNREVNTLCSKSVDEGITEAGIAMKVAVDQLREQVQNIE